VVVVVGGGLGREGLVPGPREVVLLFVGLAESMVGVEVVSGRSGGGGVSCVLLPWGFPFGIPCGRMPEGATPWRPAVVGDNPGRSDLGL
jgi:hypothetical protein